jgi:hypothetical protein
VREGGTAAVVVTKADLEMSPEAWSYNLAVMADGTSRWMDEIYPTTHQRAKEVAKSKYVVNTRIEVALMAAGNSATTRTAASVAAKHMYRRDPLGFAPELVSLDWRF